MEVINISGLISISQQKNGTQQSGPSNIPPEIRNLRAEKIESKSIAIKYEARDPNETILRHFIYLNGAKSEITDSVSKSEENTFFYKITNLKVGTIYNIQVEVSDGIESTKSEAINATTVNSFVYGIRINENNSNPNGCVTYIGDSSAFSPGPNSWINKWPFNEVCIIGLKNGEETKKINPNNCQLYVDGSRIPEDVDVMVRIPKIYYKSISSGNTYEIKISNDKVDSGYDCYAHKVSGQEKPYIYIGRYESSLINGKLRSVSRKTPLVNETIGVFRKYAQANGINYQQNNWYTRQLVNILFMLMYKTLNSQDAVGMGVCNTNGYLNTGYTDTKGMYYGSQRDNESVSFMGIENWWGNIREWIDGMFCDSSYNIKIIPDNKNFNDQANGYVKKGNANSIGGRCTKVMKSNELLFFPQSSNGSDSTYYCDYCFVNNGYFGVHGGDYYDRGDAGAFCLYVHCSASARYSYLGGRLVFFGK